MKTRQILLGIVCFASLAMTGCTKTKTCKVTSNTSASGAGTHFYYDGDRLSQVKDFTAGGTLNSDYRLYYGSNGQIEMIRIYSFLGQLSLENRVTYNSDDKMSYVANYSDQNNDGIGETLVDYFTLTYDANGDLETIVNRDNTSAIVYTCELTWVDGNITRLMYPMTNTEYVYTYDSAPNWKTNMSQFYAIYFPGTNEQCKNNPTNGEVYVGGLLDYTYSITYTYNADGLVASQGIYNNEYDCVEN